MNKISCQGNTFHLCFKKLQENYVTHVHKYILITHFKNSRRLKREQITIMFHFGRELGLSEHNGAL